MRNRDLPKFSNLYVFGDSYSDTGNVWAASEGILAAPPNYEGRFSDGRIWVDFLAAALGVDLIPSHSVTDWRGSVNFAVGGATTGTDNLFPAVVPNLPVLSGLHQQLNQFTTQLHRGQLADPDALYVLWTGASDYAPFVNGLPLYTEPTTPIAHLETALNALITFGAHHIVVGNVLDLSRTPLASSMAAMTPLSVVQTAIVAHNQALEALVRRLGPHRNLQLFDAKSVIDRLITQAARSGGVNTTESCSPETDQTEEYLFWDPVHLTSWANRELAEALLTQLRGAIPVLA